MKDNVICGGKFGKLDAVERGVDTKILISSDLAKLPCRNAWFRIVPDAHVALTNVHVFITWAIVTSLAPHN